METATPSIRAEIENALAPLRAEIAEISREPLTPGRVMNSAEAAQALRIRESTLHKLAHTGDGPPYSQPSGRGPRLYLADDILDWLRSSRVSSTHEAAVMRRRAEAAA